MSLKVRMRVARLAALMAHRVDGGGDLGRGGRAVDAQGAVSFSK